MTVPNLVAASSVGRSGFLNPAPHLDGTTTLARQVEIFIRRPQITPR